MWCYPLHICLRNYLDGLWSCPHLPWTRSTGWFLTSGTKRNSSLGGGNIARGLISTPKVGPQKAMTATTTLIGFANPSGIATLCGPLKSVLLLLSRSRLFVCGMPLWASLREVSTLVTCFAQKLVGLLLNLRTVRWSPYLHTLILLFALSSNGCTVTLSELPPPMEEW
jgi:hypothetical protein